MTHTLLKSILSTLLFFINISLQSNIHEIKRIPPEKKSPLKTQINIHFLNHKTIIIVGDYNKIMKERILSECDAYLKATANNIWWSYEFSRYMAALEVVHDYRPKISKRFADKNNFTISNNKIVDSSYWMNAIGKMRLKDPYKNNDLIELQQGVEVAHFSYIQLETPLLQGQKYTIRSKVGEKLTFTYNENKIISRAIKVNQVGYHPKAGQKYAYLGMWLGMKNKTSQTLDLSSWQGKKFYLINEHGDAVFTGLIQLRMKDQIDLKGFPVTGESTYQLDFSSFDKPGKYHIHIAGIGNSWPFNISQNSIGEAFYTHTKGLYHKRCGIAKKSPYTNWHMGACHKHSFEGGHLSYDHDYKSVTHKGEKVNYNPFQMIKDTKTSHQLNVFGGWHDAADYDRRPLHFSIVQDLLTPYLMDPEKFTDGQLNIPESGNDIPDILDEADWGMRVWLRAQKKSGAVGTWIEATSHPKQPNASLDEQPYYISTPTRESTMEYAAYAALMANAYNIAGQKDKSTEFLESSIKAFKWAIDSNNTLNKTWEATSQTGKKQKYSYKEPELKHDMTFKAALNIFILTNDRAYLKIMEKTKSQFTQKVNNMKWQGSPFFFAELLTASKRPLLRYQMQLAQQIEKEANQLLEEMNTYAYRNPWWKLNTGHYTAMGWGNWHPLKQARIFVMAHFATNKKKYKDAAYLCNDYQLGCNPLGRSMTSGLGTIYPVKFLDLISYADTHEEFVPGITPYLLTYGIYYNVRNLVFNLKIKGRADHAFAGFNTEILGNVDHVQPIYRRFGNIEGLSVPQDEYTVHETIGPAVGVTAYLIDKGFMPSEALKNRKPKKFPELKGLVPTP